MYRSQHHHQHNNNRNQNNMRPNQNSPNNGYRRINVNANSNTNNNCPTQPASTEATPVPAQDYNHVLIKLQDYMLHSNVLDNSTKHKLTSLSAEKMKKNEVGQIIVSNKVEVQTAPIQAQVPISVQAQVPVQALLQPRPH